MNLNKLLLFVCFIPMLISCKGNLNKMVSTDANMEKYIQNSEYTAIVYVDSTGGCTPCSFQHLNSWKVYQKALNKHKTEILPVINHSNEQLVIEILKSIGIFHFVFDKNDKNNKFKIMNHQIFK